MTILDNIDILLNEQRLVVIEKLPFEYDSLEPYISALTIDTHYNNHYKLYVKKLFELIKNTKYKELDILPIIELSKKENDIDIFNISSQVKNHEFYFKSMSLNTKNENLKNKVLSKFLDTGSTLFGSGWIWIVYDGNKLDVISTSNAERPANKYKLLAVCDVWEHSYYLDYKSSRNRYLKNYINYLIDWDFVEKNLSI